MNCEVKTFKFTCDICKEVVFVRDVMFYERPKGWKIIESHDCGMTGYTRYDDVCLECCLKCEKE